MLTHINNLSNVNKIVRKLGVVGAGLFITNAANATPTLPSGGGSTFQIFTTWAQNFIDFMAGPFGSAAVIVSIIIAFVTWSYAPKEGIMGAVLRTVVTGIVILNIATWVSSFS